jgi:SAM-dependent methyltransferase
MSHYERNYHEIVHKNLIKNPRYYSFRARYASKTYWKYLQGKVLEFGSGLGQNIFLNKERAEGIDISDFSIEFAKKKDVKTTKDITKIKANTFDSVFSVHCLEHLENPFSFIKEFHRILKPNGKLLLVLPVSTKNLPEKNFKPNIGKHLYGWNFSHINELLNLANFKIKLNKFNYASGYSIFYKSKFSFSLIKILGYLRNKKEMIVLAEKS